MEILDLLKRDIYDFNGGIINNQREKVSSKIFQFELKAVVKTVPHPQITCQIYHLTMLSSIDS